MLPCEGALLFSDFQSPRSRYLMAFKDFVLRLIGYVNIPHKPHTVKNMEWTTVGTSTSSTDPCGKTQVSRLENRCV
ncbi:unnamed protein product [Gadus morhua 'NCC']